MSDRVHLSSDRLADLAAGLEDPGPLESGEPRSAEEHLQGCPECSRALADGAAADEWVRGQLARLTVPSAPDDVIDRALARVAEEMVAELEEPDGELEAPDTGEPFVPAGTTVLPSTPLAGSGGPSRRLRVLASAAVVIGILAVGGVLVGGLLGQDSSTRSDTSAAAAAGSARNAVAPTIVLATGTDWTKSLLQNRLPALLKQPSALAAGSPVESVPSAGGSGAPPTTSAGETLSPTAIAQCVSMVGGGTPLLVDNAHYQGEPAVVLVFSSPTAGRDDVFVLPQGCPQGELLLYLAIAA